MPPNGGLPSESPPTQYSNLCAWGSQGPQSASGSTVPRRQNKVTLHIIDNDAYLSCPNLSWSHLMTKLRPIIPWPRLMMKKKKRMSNYLWPHMFETPSFPRQSWRRPITRWPTISRPTWWHDAGQNITYPGYSWRPSILPRSNLSWQHLYPGHTGWKNLGSVLPWPRLMMDQTYSEQTWWPTNFHWTFSAMINPSLAKSILATLHDITLAKPLLAIPDGKTNIGQFSHGHTSCRSKHTFDFLQ